MDEISHEFGEVDQIAERVKDWEIIADNLKKHGWSLDKGLSHLWRRANDLDCGRASRRKAFHCAGRLRRDAFLGKGMFRVCARI